MKVLGHAALSLTMAGILYNYSHSFGAAACFLITGVFIDLDHYLDYVREHGVSLNLKKIYNTCSSYMNFKKTTLVLHSYELIILFWLAILVFNLNIIWKYAFTGLTLHLLVDQLTNPIPPLTYFIWYRVVNNFETSKMFIDKGVDYAHRNR